MQLGEFHTMVSRTLKRGDSLDSVIPSRVRQAVRLLERNYPMKYMETWITLSLDVTDQLVNFPWAFRNFKFLRMPMATGEYQYLQPFRSEEQEEVNVEFSGYEQIGVEAIRFSAAPPKPLQLEGKVFKFSDWQTTQSDFRHYMLEVGEDLLLYQTLINMGVLLKDERMIAAHKAMRDEALRAFFSMDQQQQEDGLDGTMEYRSLY